MVGSLGDDTLIGGEGQDNFVLQRRRGVDVITDFLPGEDFLELSGGLRFSQLTIAQGTGENSSDTLISHRRGGDLIAVLSDVDASTIAVYDFI